MGQFHLQICPHGAPWRVCQIGFQKFFAMIVFLVGPALSNFRPIFECQASRRFIRTSPLGQFFVAGLLFVCCSDRPADRQEYQFWTTIRDKNTEKIRVPHCVVRLLPTLIYIPHFQLIGISDSNKFKELHFSQYQWDGMAIAGVTKITLKNKLVLQLSLIHI